MSLKQINVNNTLVTNVDDEPIAQSKNIANSGGVVKYTNIMNDKIYHLNEGSKYVVDLNSQDFELSIEFYLLPLRTGYHSIVEFYFPDETIIGLGVYKNSKKLYFENALDILIECYKKTKIVCKYENGDLNLYLNGTFLKSISKSGNIIRLYFNRTGGEPFINANVSYFNIQDNQSYYDINFIENKLNNGELIDNIFKFDIEIIRSEQFDQIGSDKVKWSDGTIGDIQSLIFDQNSLGVSSYIITYKDYIVTQPTITYNVDGQIISKPELTITKNI